MTSSTADLQPSRALNILGWVLSILPASFLLFGSVTAWHSSPEVIAGTAKLGYTADFLHILAPIEFVCAVLYLVPRTAVFGALLLTAYCGGAVASHLRISDPTWPAPIVFAIILWAGLLMRRPLLRKLIL
ncbi:DoxX family protein [Granulicella arctica]|uniref:DoxX family protein n=1 Tax=Granulicella arctica TaxID=940613 RepID=UPI0021E09737|nr:DoxX family protein [Granulicella arctica]